jgi:hypothetical protein
MPWGEDGVSQWIYWRILRYPQKMTGRLPNIWTEKMYALTANYLFLGQIRQLG